MNILWVPHTGWHIPQRAHGYCRELARRHAVHVTDWVADFASPRDYLSTKYLRNFRYQRRQDGLVHVHRIPRFSPALPWAALRRLNESIYLRYVYKIIAAEKIEAVISTFVIPPPAARLLIFDLFDENVAGWAQSHPAYAREIQRNEAAYLRQADAVLAASSVLVDKARQAGAGERTHWIPNGIDLPRYAALELPARASCNGLIRAGSVGNHDNPAEVARLIAAAQLLPADYRVVVAGRGRALRRAAAGHNGARRAGRHASLELPGFIPPDRLAFFLNELDIGLCPYNLSPMDDARCPMRLLEYAALGLPTVCTHLREVERMAFPNVVMVDAAPEAFAEGIRQAAAMQRVSPAGLGFYDLERNTLKIEALLK